MAIGRTMLAAVVIALVGACSSGGGPEAAPSPSGADSTAPTTDTAARQDSTAPTTAATDDAAADAVTSPPGPIAIADDVLPPDRRTTWNPGVTYGGGGIPDRTEVCETLSPSGGDDTSAIQNALDSCSAGGVVQLTEGTFEIYGDGLGFRTSEVTLRGSGTGQPESGEGGTRLVKTDRETNRNSAILYLGNNPGLFASSTDLAADAVKGTSTVTLTDDPGLEVGEYVLVDHVTNDDPDVVWNVYHDGPGGGSRRWFDRQDRSLSQILEVTAVDGTTVTFATPFHWTFRSDFDAQLSRYGDDNGGNVLPFVEWAGVEDLYLYGGMGGDYHGNIAMSTCAYCWVRNVESDFSEGTAIGMYGTYRSELRDSYVHSTSSPNPGGGGYLTGVSYGGSDNLIENNIFWRGNKMLVMRASGGGNVVAYNYMEDGYGEGYVDIVEVGLNATHYTTPHMELLEGNQAFNADGDSYWGNSIAITLFRNHLTGERRDVAGLGLRDDKNRRMASLNQYQYDYNFLGNVLGTEGMTAPAGARFVYEAADLDLPEIAVWQLGYVGEDPGQPFDPKVAETAIRHGNFDYITGTIAWDPELSQELPPSLYLAEKPAFFGDAAWPWVTPENPDGAVAALPARVRFDAMTNKPADPVPSASTGAEDDAAGSGSAEGMAHLEIDSPEGQVTVDAQFDVSEYSESSDGRVHLYWESADGGYLILELSAPSTGTHQSTGFEPFFLEVVASAAEPDVGLATVNSSCSLTIDELSDTSITGTFACQPSSDGYSATGSFDAAAST